VLPSEGACDKFVAAPLFTDTQISKNPQSSNETAMSGAAAA